MRNKLSSPSRRRIRPPPARPTHHWHARRRPRRTHAAGSVHPHGRPTPPADASRIRNHPVREVRSSAMPGGLRPSIGAMIPTYQRRSRRAGRVTGAGRAPWRRRPVHAAPLIAPTQNVVACPRLRITMTSSNSAWLLRPVRPSTRRWTARSTIKPHCSARRGERASRSCTTSAATHPGRMEARQRFPCERPRAPSGAELILTTHRKPEQLIRIPMLLMVVDHANIRGRRDDPVNWPRQLDRAGIIPDHRRMCWRAHAAVLSNAAKGIHARATEERQRDGRFDRVSNKRRGCAAAAWERQGGALGLVRDIIAGKRP